jgi:polyhydroxybutyrate depolymerase
MTRNTLSFVIPIFASLTSLACDPAPMVGSDAGAATDDAYVASDDAGPDAPLPPTRLPVGTADRPVDINLPPAHDGTTRLPLFILLHGYSSNAAQQDAYLGFSRAVRAAGAYSILPNGTVDAGGNRFWNASASCCNFAGSSVDDESYLMGLIDAAEAVVPVDTTRIYFFGHSNGAFMAHRMACNHADRIAAVGTLAGTEAMDFTCTPARPISVLQIHGTADATIEYPGGRITGSTPYVSAEEVVSRWAMRDGCDAMRTPGAVFDWDTAVTGPEATPSTYAGCDGGSAVELWTLTGSGHIPFTNATGIRSIVDWLLARHS